MEDNGKRLVWENGSLIRKGLGDAEPEKERGGVNWVLESDASF